MWHFQVYRPGAPAKLTLKQCFQLTNYLRFDYVIKIPPFNRKTWEENPKDRLTHIG